jgi:hypothetical protein
MCLPQLEYPTLPLPTLTPDHVVPHKFAMADRHQEARSYRSQPSYIRQSGADGHGEGRTYQSKTSCVDEFVNNHWEPKHFQDNAEKVMQIIKEALAADLEDKRIKHQLSARGKDELSLRKKLQNSEFSEPYTVNKIKESDDIWDRGSSCPVIFPRRHSQNCGKSSRKVS